MIAETHGRGFVTPFMPTLAPLRTMIRLALALRPVLLGPMLTRLLKPSYNVAPNGQSAPPHGSRYPLPSANRRAMNSFIVFIWSGEKVFFPRKPGRLIL